MLDRDWPPAPLMPQAERKTLRHTPAQWVAATLLPISPLVAWLVFVLPGEQSWAGLLWPAGWTLAVLVLMAGGWANEGRS